VLGHTVAHGPGLPVRPSRGYGPWGSDGAWKPSALTARSLRAWWRAGRRPGGARPATRSCRQAWGGGLRGGAGHGEVERGSPVQRGDGEAACSGGSMVFRCGVGLRWSAMSFAWSCSTRVGWGVRRGQWWRMTMAGGGSSP
jgi:hypothetical protein